MFARFKLVYKLRIDATGVQIVAGKPPARFLAAVRDITTLHAIEEGEIECKGAHRHARLRFSKDFPERGRQAVRNVWSPPTTPGPTGGSRSSG